MPSSAWEYRGRFQRLSFMSNKDAVVTLKEGRSSESKLFLAEDNERQEPLRGIKSHLRQCI